MRTITIGGEKLPAKFTTWTVAEFYKLTKINLYDPNAITKVFRRYGEDENVTPDDFSVIAKLAYCAIASGAMPEDAADDWKPSFTVTQIMNRIPVNSPELYGDLLSVYFDKDLEAVKEAIQNQVEEAPKNVVAPTVGQ